MNAQTQLGVCGVEAAVLHGVAEGLLPDQRSVTKQPPDVPGSDLAETAMKEVFGRCLHRSESGVGGTRGENSSSGNQHPGVPLRVAGEAQLWVVLEATQKDAVKALMEGLGRSGTECGSIGIDVVLEVAA